MFNFKKLLISSTAFMLVPVLSTLVAFADTNRQGVTSSNRVNIRETATTDAKVLTTLEKGTRVSVISASGDWTKVKYNKTTGWIFSSLLSVTNVSRSSAGTGTVTVQVLNVRSKAALSSSVIQKLQKGDKVSILESSGDWLKVKTSGGKTGWVYSSYVSTKTNSVNSTSRGSTTARTMEGVYEKTSLEGDIVAYAKKYLGTKYVYGGNSPSEGFDCSGFVKYVYGHFGISLTRTAAEQAAKGKKVSKSDLQTGDLVFFDTNGGHNNINHVGIFIGNGKFIHASSPRYDVTITELSDAFYSRSYMTARRILD